jgi:hypothetical protein
LIIGVSDLAGDLADGVDIQRVDFGFEQVGAGNTIGGEGGAVLPSGDLVAGIGVADDEAGKAAVGGVGVEGDAGGFESGWTDAAKASRLTSSANGGNQGQ